MFLKISQNSQENICARVSFLIKLQVFIKKETLAKVVSCEFCEIFTNTFFHRTPLVAASTTRLRNTEFEVIIVSFNQLITIALSNDVCCTCANSRFLSLLYFQKVSRRLNNLRAERLIWKHGTSCFTDNQFCNSEPNQKICFFTWPTNNR